MSNKTYIGTTEAAKYLGISTVRLRILLQQGRVKGAQKEGRVWMIPLFKGMPVIDERRKGPERHLVQAPPPSRDLHPGQSANYWQKRQGKRE
jgi:hypothetical protein